jgi:hypothetical protein
MEAASAAERFLMASRNSIWDPLGSDHAEPDVGTANHDAGILLTDGKHFEFYSMTETPSPTDGTLLSRALPARTRPWTPPFTL